LPTSVEKPGVAVSPTTVAGEKPATTRNGRPPLLTICWLPPPPRFQASRSSRCADITGDAMAFQFAA
jgi:hypothetical protein